MLSYPDCEACACETKKTQEGENDTASQLEDYSDEVNFGPIIDATYTETFSKGLVNQLANGTYLKRAP